MRQRAYYLREQEVIKYVVKSEHTALLTPSENIFMKDRYLNIFETPFEKASLFKWGP